MKFCLPLSLFALCASAAPYIVTTYVELSVYTEDYGYTDSETTIPASVYTYTDAVIPATPVSAIATLTESAGYADVTVIQVVVESGSAVTQNNYDSSYTQISYVVPVTYTPEPTCTSQNWTFTTNVPVYVPDIVSLPAVTTFTSATTISYEYYSPTPTTGLVAVVNPTDVDASDLAAASSEYMPYGLSYCYTPTTSCATGTASAASCTTTFVYDSSASYYYGGDPYFDDKSWITPLVLICVLVPVGWFLIWLFIGLWESWMSFKGLMLGRHRKRGLPYAWCCISILFLCWVGPTYKAKSAAEQEVLQERWKAMSKREKFKLWMKWGFRWKYPDVLGEEPEFAKRAFRQGCL